MCTTSEDATRITIVTEGAGELLVEGADPHPVPVAIVRLRSTGN